ncbi:MAG: hypothetical protein ACREKS_16965, partial [Candidatus Rokuibacteriota bacterium]
SRLGSGPETAAKATFALTHPGEPARDPGTHRVSFNCPQTGSVAAATGGEVRRGVKTVPSRSNA